MVNLFKILQKLENTKINSYFSFNHAVTGETVSSARFFQVPNRQYYRLFQSFYTLPNYLQLYLVQIKIKFDLQLYGTRFTKQIITIDAIYRTKFADAFFTILTFISYYINIIT